MSFRLFQHTPTGRWFPIIQDSEEYTPGEKYIPDIAKDYQLPRQTIKVVLLDDLPKDFESNSIVTPEPPQSQRVIDRDDAITKLDVVSRDNKFDPLLRDAIAALIKVLRNG